MRQPPPAAAATSGRRTVHHHRHHLLAVAHHPLHRVASGLAHVPAGLLRQVGRAGPLESPWLAVGLAALVPATVALIALSHHWHGRHGGPPRRRWLRRGALAAWLALLSALAGLAGLNAYVGYVPTLSSLFGDLPIEIGQAAGGGGSSVVSFDIAAPSLRVPPSRCYVYLPPGYRPRAQRSRRYPVVYLLHGYPGGPIDWFRVELMAGDHDPEAKEAARLARMLRARGQYALFSEVHGAGHTWRAARVEAPYVLAFASGHLAGWESTLGMT